MSQPQDDAGDRRARERHARAASGPDEESDATTQADAGMSGDESPASVEPHAEPTEPDDEDQ